MYIDDSVTSNSAPMAAGTGWQVEVGQVREFAMAVEAVRADLMAITREVEELSTPAFQPMLGTSPVGQELAQKFIDRMGSETGLRGQLNVALQRMEEFVAGAEATAAQYQQADQDNASKHRFV